MTVTTYLSPNGQDTTRGDGPATRILIATVEGVATLSRETPDAPWRLTGRSLEHRHVGSMVYEPVSGKLFAGAHSDGGLWVSDDGEGRSWRELTHGLDRRHIYSLATRRMGDKVTIFAGTQPAALYRSDDFGETWRELDNLRKVPGTEKWTFPPPPHIAHVKSTIFHPEDPTTIFALVEQGALLKSADDGETWSELDSYSDPNDTVYRDTHRMLIGKDSPNVFYLATGEGIYRSDDGGASWEHLILRSDRGGYTDFLFFKPGDENAIFMGGASLDPGRWRKEGLADSHVMLSTDRGATWTGLAEGLPSPVIGAFEAMTLHQWDGGMMLVVGTATGQVYASENEGASWTCIAENVTPVSKDHHHIAFLPPEQAEVAMAARRA
jgi:photosystem II stability/assembly factor-like uncharacterized protein